MDSDEFCIVCEGLMTLVRSPGGETFLSCQQCGEFGDGNVGEDLVSSGPNIGSLYAYKGEGAKPEGFRYTRFRVGCARRREKANLNLICQQFNVTKLKKEMDDLFAKVRYRHLNATVGAVFLTVVRRHLRQNPNQGIHVTLRQVSNFLGVPVPKIASCLKHVDRVVDTSEEPCTGAVTSPKEIVSSILPEVVFSDPLMLNVDITSRVLKLTEKVIELFQRLSVRSIDPSILTITAGFLAWRSCFFYQKAHHGHVPLELVKIPTKPGTLSEYLTLTKLNANARLVKSIERGVTIMNNTLSELLLKMPWLQLRGKKSARTFVPQYLEEILEFQEMTCSDFHKEAEIKRQEEPIVIPVVPRELTAEERAALEEPELSEKDLPDSELARYVRSAKEVESIRQLAESSSDSE